MQKKLTITLDEKVYRGLHSVIGRGNIGQFIDLAKRYTDEVSPIRSRNSSHN